MSFAYLPLYTGDYLRDTRHLSMAEHGAYLLMLTYCWDQRGPLPLDRHRIQGICNARSKDEQEAVERVLADFFVVMEDGLYNKRMQAEIERCDQISRARAQAGKLGYEARAKHLPNKSHANAKQVHLSPSPSLSPSLETSKPLAPSRREKPRRAEPKSPKPIGFGDLVATIPAIGGDCEVCESAVAEWQDTYPDCDVPATLREIRAWVVANPTKRKSNVARFVNAWLKREQDRG